MKDNRWRLLDIFTQLLEGKAIKISELVEKKYGTEDTIRKDKDSIREFLAEKDLDRELFGQVEYQHGIGFFLDRSFTLTDDERIAMIKVLLSSRALHREEMLPIVDKLIKQSSEPKRLEGMVKSEKFTYNGVPKSVDMLERIKLIQYATEHQIPVSFTYQKNFQTFEYNRIPLGVVFIDIYFYMISASHTSEDFLDFEHANKFRINNMSNLRIDESVSVPRLQYSQFPKLGELRNQTGRWAFLGKPIELEVECLFDPAYILDRFPESRIISQDPEKKVAKMVIPTNDGYGTKMWILSQSNSMKVNKPNYMRASIIQILNQIVNLYGYELVKKVDK